MNVNLIVGDITSFEGDVIVNSANKSLLRGSGVSGAIHSKAGCELEQECRGKHMVLNVGQCVVTKGYNLGCRYVIHVLGGTTKDTLVLSYKNVLWEADRLEICSIAIPALSTGIHGVNFQISAQVVKEVLNAIQLKYIKDIYLYFAKQEHKDIYIKEWGIKDTKTFIY